MKRTITFLLVALLALGVLVSPALALDHDPSVPRPKVHVGDTNIRAESDDIGYVDPKQRAGGWDGRDWFLLNQLWDICRMLIFNDELAVRTDDQTSESNEGHLDASAQ